MEAKTALRRVSGGAHENIGRRAAAHICCFVCGLLVSRGAVLGTLAPFGASYAAAVPRKNLPSALFGVGLGYVLQDSDDTFRYLAVTAAIGALRWLLGDLKHISESKLFAPLAAFVPIFATGISLLFVSTTTLSRFSDCAIEAVIASAAAYFMNTALRLANGGRSIEVFTQQESACVVMSMCVFVLALGSVEWQGISLGRIVAMLLVLLCARCGSVSGGAVCGAATGSVFSLASSQNGFVCGGFAFGGLVAGLFAPLGKLWCAFAFVASNGVMSLAFGLSTTLPSSVVVESLIAAAIFAVLPRDVESFISPVFSGTKSTELGEAVRKNIVMRLDFAAKAVGNVKNDVTRVSQKMEELYEPSFETVCRDAQSRVCEGCGLKMYCFEHKQGVTRDDFARLEEALEANGRIDENDVEREFVKNCCKKGEVADAMNRGYREYRCALEAKRRVTDVRAVVAGQFSGVGNVLHDLAEEFRRTLRCDTECSARLISALTGRGVIVTECVCMVSGGGRMNVELTYSDKSEKISRKELSAAASRCCGRRFDLPVLSRESGRVRAAMCEMPLLDVEIGTAQHVANGGKLCGDCLNYFNDGFGKTYALVCDGMGTGGRAAVDGNMAASIMTRLLRSGLSPDSSLQIVNSALMVKSEDESLSTVDVLGIDLYTGRVTMKKAGAPATFIKKNGRVTAREMPSMPVGILNGVSFAADSVNLTEGDMVVMVSDGAITGDERWLERLIRTWSEGSVQDLAHAVVSEAQKRCASGREDDITALAVRIVKNE